MKKISEWSDRAINWLGITVVLIMVTVLISFAKYVERKWCINPDPGAVPVVTVDSLEVGTAYVDTLGLLTMDVEAIVPVGALQNPDGDISEHSRYIVMIYPVKGSVEGSVYWIDSDAGLLSYTSSSGPNSYRYPDDSGGDIMLGYSGFPYILMID